MAAKITASPNFEGWYIHPDAEPLTCPQGTFTTSGPYAVCCDKTKCPMPTACHDNKISYDNFAVGACPGSAVCQTMSIMSAPGAKGDVTSSIFCAQYWYALEAYRDTVPVTTSSATKTSTSASTGSTPTSNSASRTGSVSTTGSSSSAGSSGTTSPTSTPEPSAGGSSSKAWIAGAVVGPVAGLALLGFAFWFLRRRGAQKKKNVNAADAPQEIGGYERPADYGDGNWQNKQYYGASHPKAESTSAGYYAPVQQNQVHELPGGEQR
ncbi:hypothetical protein IF1G_05966 [Cordyceps javanica]|uniref:Uncharacterized protein n=1 Tax=Cordyceps javanica TaxID=43265 RepID=A0A545VVR7_9HYPO|nr:hypothetical protein IF1G_05966 [Cordyceps javanica]TQW05811.1 hypothetical protein IF2G_06933 [Cordyceps javanica]